MFKVINKLVLAEGVKRLDIEARNIAVRIKPGQFVNICVEEGDERIPLAVVEYDAKKGVISVIFQENGAGTKKLGDLPINESIFSVLGPLGTPATIEKRGEVICIATGMGGSQILPIIRALAQAGNKVIGVIGAKTKRRLLLEPQIRIACDKIFISTEDGSYERRVQATEILQELVDHRKIKLVYAIGSAEMMEAVCRITKVKEITTYVQLNPMMIDCMGMCGSCRVKVGNRILLACTDGPEFDGHKVDFKDYKIRINAFEGLQQWHNQRLPQLNPREETGLFKRFLSGILSE